MGRTSPNPSGSTAQLILSARQVRALISPVRQEIVDALESAGPRSVAELAALLGQAPDGLYFHLRHLERSGLVVERERRKTGRHVAAVYDLVTRPLRLSYAAPARAGDLAAVIASALRLATRDFRRALHRAGVATEGPNRELWGARAKGWVTPAQILRINELLNEVSEIMRAGTPRPSARPLSLSFVLAPSPPSPRAAKRTSINPAVSAPSPSKASRSASASGLRSRSKDKKEKHS